MKKTILSLFTLVLTLNLSIFASGFQINEHGARAMAMAGAFTGLATDASTVYYNPAGLTNLNGTHFLAGVTLIAPSASFTGPTPLTTETEMESQVFTPFNFYVTHRFSEQWAVGLGVNNQYGLGTEWPEDWVGNELAVDTEIRSFYFTPAVAFKPSDVFSIGVGLTYAFADVKILRKSAHPLPGQPKFELNLEGDATSIGFSAGVFVKPSEVVSLGLSYRSENSFDFEGDATSTPSGFTHPQLGVTIPFPNGPVKAPLTTPQNITFGIGLTPSECLTVSADFQYVGWSSYDKLEVTFENYDLDPTTPEKENVQSADRKYENSFIARLGAEYLISPEFALRGGFLYDKNPVQDEYVEPTLPDADRIGINIGFGYNFSESVKVDFAYLLLLFSEREVTNSKFGFNGTYQNTAHLFGLNFGYAIN